MFCVLGSGGYADNNIGAVSTTGHGEAIMKVTLARLILFHMEQGKAHTSVTNLYLKHAAVMEMFSSPRGASVRKTHHELPDLAAIRIFTH